MKIFLLSPHYDDVCFSICSFVKLLKKFNNDITIINIYTISKYTENSKFIKLMKGLDTISRIKLVSLLRKTEDRKFINKYNLKQICLNLFDADLYSSNVFHTNQNSFLINELYDCLYKIFNQIEEKILIFCPLGIGNHRNHLTTFDTVVKLKNILGNKIILSFYYDMPYITNNINIENRMKKIESFFEKDFVKINYILNKNEIENKTNSVKLYKTQLNKKLKNNELLNLFFLKINDNYNESIIIEDKYKNLILECFDFCEEI